MKTTITLFLILVCSVVYGQTSDVMYVPNDKSLVVTYNNNYSGLGFYMGGYITTSFPQPYMYTTPQSRINRAGISLTYKNKVSVMGGVFLESFIQNTEFKPDVWVKIYPLRILLNVERGPDFTLGVNYMNGINYGMGLSIPFR
jgi:hypothetical protein